MARRTATAAAIAVALLVILPRLRVPAAKAGALTDPRLVPHGAYTGSQPLPDHRMELVDRTLEGLGGPAGIVQGGSTARNRRYFGTDVVPAPYYDRQTVNRDVDLELAPVKARRSGGML